jgi:dihydroorotate dehydrogenase electron transfer subunit
MVLCGNIPAWQAGTTLLLEGPYGKGFSNSLRARRLLIHAMEKSLEERLYPLANNALKAGADVAWVSEALSIGLPPQIEVLKVTEFTDAMQWADGCAIAVPLARLSNLSDELAIKPADRVKVEVMIDAPFVCGNAQCGVCAIETRAGWKLACKDGPVFPYAELFQ